MARNRMVILAALTAALLSSCGGTQVDHFPVSLECECEQVQNSLVDVGLLEEGHVVSTLVHTNNGIFLEVRGSVPYGAILESGSLDILESKGVRVNFKENSVGVRNDELKVFMHAGGYSMHFDTSDWGTSDSEIKAWNKAWQKRELGDEFAQQEADAVAIIQDPDGILKLLGSVDG